MTHRRAFTLIELVASLAALTMLIGAMAAAVLLAGKAIPAGNTPTEAAIAIAPIVKEIADDISQAIYITERTAQAITIVVPDRGADGKPDIIRYAWSGSTGAPLLRQINSGALQTLVSSASSFAITYDQRNQAISVGGGVSINRPRIAAVYLTLAVTIPAAARYDTTAQTHNRPPVISAFWETDFSTNPTQLDLDASGSADWSVNSGSFDAAELNAGVWSPSNKSLRTAPEIQFLEPTTIEMRLRDTSTTGQGALFTIYYDRALLGLSYTKIDATLHLDNPSSQKLTLYHYTGLLGTKQQLGEIENLTPGFIEVMLALEPASNRLGVYVNGVLRASYTYGQILALLESSNYASFSEQAANVEFSHVRILVGGTP